MGFYIRGERLGSAAKITRKNGNLKPRSQGVCMHSVDGKLRRGNPRDKGAFFRLKQGNRIFVVGKPG